MYVLQNNFEHFTQRPRPLKNMQTTRVEKGIRIAESTKIIQLASEPRFNCPNNAYQIARRLDQRHKIEHS